MMEGVHSNMIYLRTFISATMYPQYNKKNFFLILLFICAYKAWVISPPCPHPKKNLFKQKVKIKSNSLSLSVAFYFTE
jgi:hypothetical protein